MSEMTNITTEASDSPVSNKTVCVLMTCANPLETRRCCVGISFDIHQHEVVALPGAFRFRQIHIDEMRQPA